MPLTITQPRKVGRPQASPRTIRILPSGYIRLSPDLCTAKTFTVSFNKLYLRLFIKPSGRLTLKYSSAHAKSGLLDARRLFTSWGVIPSEVAREYSILGYHGSAFYVDLEGHGGKNGTANHPAA